VVAGRSSAAAEPRKQTSQSAGCALSLPASRTAKWRTRCKQS